jgi:hypothetical protein
MSMSKDEPSRHSDYYELLDACKHPGKGCPVCRLALGGVARYLDSIQYEFVNDPPTRAGLVAAGGYCNDHAWQLREMHAALGIAIMYRDVLRAARQTIAGQSTTEGYQLFGERPGTGGLLGRVAAMVGSEREATDIADPHLYCPACEDREGIERRYLGVLLDHLIEEETAQALGQAGGLCLVHLDQAARVTRDWASLKRLGAVQIPLLQQLEDELTEFARKRDYRFHDEPYGSEKDSWIRAIEMVAGKRGVR